MAATHHSTISCNSYSMGFSLQTYQITPNRNKSQQISMFLNSNKTLQYAHCYGILRLVQVAKEMSRDHDGRRNLLHARGDCQVTEDGRRLSNATPAPEENTCLQNQWAMAYRPRRIQGIYGKEQEHSRRQIKKADMGQQQNNSLAAQGLSVDWNPDDNPLSSLRRLLRILPYVVRCCQPLGNIWMSCKGGGWRACYE